MALVTAIVFGLYSLPVGKHAPVNFASLELNPRPNQYLACPEGFCTAEPHRASPIYDLTVGELRTKWSAWAAAQAGLAIESSLSDGSQVTYVERSRIMGFPDLITVHFVPVGERQSAVAIYSRSVYGYSDLGVNRARVDRWLEHFQG